MRFGRLFVVGALLASSIGAVIGLNAGTVGACPVENNDGTIHGSDASVNPFGGDVNGLYDVDGDGETDAPPEGVPPSAWPFDTNSVSYDEPNKTVYIDDRDFDASADDTLGPGQSLREAQIGQAIGQPGFNISPVDSKSGDEEGFWIYVETNTRAGLQRGGNNVAFEVSGVDDFPVIIEGGPDRNGDGYGDGNEIIAENHPIFAPAFPDGIYLFADDEDQEGDQSGFPSGGSLAQTAGAHDPCNDTDDPNTQAVETVSDSILF